MLGNRRVFDCSCFHCTEVVDKLRTSFLRGKSSLTSSSTSVCQKGIYKATARALEREKQPNKMASTRSFAAHLRLSSTQRHGQKPNNCIKLGQKVVKRLVGVRIPLGPQQQCPVCQACCAGDRSEGRIQAGSCSLPCSVPIKPLLSGSFPLPRGCELPLLCPHRLCCASPHQGCSDPRPGLWLDPGHSLKPPGGTSWDPLKSR